MQRRMCLYSATNGFIHMCLYTEANGCIHSHAEVNVFALYLVSEWYCKAFCYVYIMMALPIVGACMLNVYGEFAVAAC